MKEYIKKSVYNKWYFNFFFNTNFGYYLFKNELDFIYYIEYEYKKKEWYESRIINKSTDVKIKIFKLIISMMVLLFASKLFINFNIQVILLLILIEICLFAIIIKYLIRYYIYKLCEQINDERYQNQVNYDCDSFNSLWAVTKNGILSSLDYGETEFTIINQTNKFNNTFNLVNIHNIDDNIQIVLNVYEIPDVIKSHINNDHRDFIIDILNRELLNNTYIMKPKIIITYK